MSGSPEGLPAVEARVSQLMMRDSCRLPKAIKKLLTASSENEGDEIVYSEEADTWAFCWMPALDDFLESESERKGTVNEKSYNQILLSDRTFHNPHALEEMAAAFRMAHPRMQARSFLINPPAMDEGRFFADDIRDLQNKCYADEKVKAGVELNRNGKYQEALKMYEQALSTCPRHVDAFVARGAAKANLGQLRHAMEDFEEALRIDPGVQNARNYLQTIRAKLDSSLSERLTSRGRGTTPSPHQMPSLARASGKGHGGEARPSSLDHYVDLTDEPLAGHKPPAEPIAGAGEYSSTIGKLEQLIRAEEQGGSKRRKEKRKHRKGKKRRRQDSSSASEAESTEEEDDEDRKRRQEKKKRKKKDKKKRKKRREDASESSAESLADDSRKKGQL